MQELRLMGVDGEHLRLSSEQGVPYKLHIDEALRAAISRDDDQALPPGHDIAATSPLAPHETIETNGKPGQPAKPAKPPRPPVHLTPRDIQARIRSGATAEQVADESGSELRHVQRYEGPVRAERDYVAYLAQRVEVASPLPSHDGYRSAFGDAPAQLGDMVAYRIRSYGTDPATVEWDSWRLPDGSWHVVARFDLPEESQVDLGEQPPAWWTYNPTRKTIANGNRWAQVLSELEPLDGPLPSRRLSAVADRVFDFEAEKSTVSTPDEEPGESDSASTPTEEQDSLLDVLRSRRGQRLGADEEGDDALAVLLTRGSDQASRPQDGGTGEAPDDAKNPALPGLALAPGSATDDSRAGETGHADEQSAGSADRHDGARRPTDRSGKDTRAISVLAHPSARRQSAPAPAQSSKPKSTPDSTPKTTPTSQLTPKAKGGDPEDPADSSTDASNDPAVERRVKQKRSSVPSWDDIVFGRRTD